MRFVKGFSAKKQQPVANSLPTIGLQAREEPSRNCSPYSHLPRIMNYMGSGGNGIVCVRISKNSEGFTLSEAILKNHMIFCSTHFPAPIDVRMYFWVDYNQ